MDVRSLFDLTGRVAVVTGGSVGLGRQMAEGRAEAGARLVLCARKLPRCEQAAEELRAGGAEVLALSCDVKDPESVATAVAAMMERFGRIDFLVNNAGTTWGAPAEAMALPDWTRVLDTNLTGSFLFSQAVGRVMLAAGRGSILNIASIAGLRGMGAGLDAIAYSTSKGGLLTFTRDLATKWGARGIRVNALAPGWFPSDMSKAVLERQGGALLEKIPLGRFGGADDLKGAAVFFASDASAFVTGQVLAVDGGQTA